MKMKRITHNLINQYLLHLLILSNLTTLISSMNVLINDEKEQLSNLSESVKRFKEDKDVCFHNCEMNEVKYFSLLILF